MGRWRRLPDHAMGRVGLLVLAAAVVLAGGAWLLWPKPAAQSLTATPPHRPSIPILVSIGLPGQRSSLTVHPGQTIQVAGHALGSDPIADLELWDGASRFGVQAQPGTIPAAHGIWEWQSGEVGDHVLLVRAVDAAGRVAQSDVAQVTVTGDPVAEVPARIVQAVSSEPDYALALPKATTTVDGCVATVRVPAADASVSGYAFLGLAPGTARFVSLGTLTAHPADGAETFTVPLPAGHSLLTVTSFSGTAEAYGAPMIVTAPSTCRDESGWSGQLRLVDGKLTPAPDVDRAYLYLALDGGAARRIPSDPATFVTPADGALDFSAFLPAIAGTHLHLEAWGWKGGLLTRLGTGDWTQPDMESAGPGHAVAGWDRASPAALAISSTLSVLVSQTVTTNCTHELCTEDVPQDHDQITRPDAGTTQPIKRTFAWSTRLVGVTSVIWQVLPYPTVSTPDLAPPFLMGSGTVPVSGDASSGQFTIDFLPFLIPGPMSAAIGDTATTSARLASTLFGGQAAPASTPSPTPTPTSAGHAVAGQPGAGAIGSADLANSLLLNRGPGLLGFSGRFYVRIIPIAEGAPGQASPPVTLDMVDPPTFNWDPGSPPDPGSYDLSIQVTPPRAPDSRYVRCSIVTAISPGFSGGMVADAYDFPGHLASGKPYCYQPPDDGWSIWDAFDAFVDFVADVWDKVTQAYDWIKGKIVDAVLVLVPCKEIASDDTCRAIANAALEAVATSFGIPPSLPNFDAVVSAAKGDLASFVVTAAGSIPGVDSACGLADAANTVTSKVKDCDDIARAAIDEAVDRIIATRSSAAAQSAGVLPFPGVTLAPDPRGVWQAPEITYTVTRTDDPYVPDTCDLSVGVTSTLKDWTFMELQDGWETQVTRTVSGSPFVPATGPIPALKPGESYTGHLWLTKPANWIESTRALLYVEDFELGQSTNHAWVLLQQGAALTFTATSNCTPDVSQSMTLTSAGFDG